ncbi:MAG: 23S rRNA (guanosine(2251)-2'-O)-methyltransferase RlmB [Proteobacteria bacterium]|nr:23S rRNA (guanosine(2251)-2'-O)-methyltransferase RlmB [Pseudomonadota bacterium]MBU1714494.1 23S rRNA (guanosine(2251)-2'-O)-methyltransferase RlmB [Pseudomonadota bacterium]
MTTNKDELIWGIHPVMELLEKQPDQLREIIIQQPGTGESLQKIITLAKKHQIRLTFQPQIKIPGGSKKVNHQGVLAKISLATTISLQELLNRTSNYDAPLVLALDSVQDPHNLGAIIRSGAAAGVAGIIITKDRSAPLSGTVAKVSAGGLAHVNICQVTNLATTLNTLKEKGFWIFGADKEKGQSLYETDFTGPTCLIIGGENKGMRPLIKEQCDFLVTIPMKGELDSLNAAVAAGIIIFEMTRPKPGKPKG